MDARIIAYPAPISRLPSELLLSIFSYFVGQDHYEPVQAVRHVPHSVSWVRFTHVCRRWRHVMLASPSLWRNIILPMPPKWADAMLARSKLLPVNIYCSVFGNGAARSEEWLLPFNTLEKVKILDLSRFKGSPADLAPLLSTPAPLLEIVEIEMLPQLSPAQLFADHAPRLRELTIRDAPTFLWTSSFVRNLVHLDVNDIKNSPPSLPDFVAGLQQLSQIETLVLKGCLHSFSVLPSSAAPQVVQLPSLLKLEISGEVSQCVGFLRHLKTLDVELGVTSITEGGISDFDEIYPFLVPKCGYKQQPYRFVGFRSMDSENLTLTAGHANSGRTNRTFAFEWKDPEDTVVDLMCTLCDEIGVRHLSSLSIELDEPLLKDATWLMPTEWLGTFGRATELESLVATGNVGTSLCLVLAASKADETWRRSGAAGGTIAWPRLRDVMLYDVYLPSSFKSGDEDAAITAGMRVGEVLLRELQRRHECGAALEKLHLVSCSATPSWLRNVKRVVSNVVAEYDDEGRIASE
ncbi:hypothetical protein FA95DRAFT_1561146 [Auriscalpium vulgare]|uniref:Uncharacterized protein n=1 Tax=Auriscalpium vulgare TaxID=40419 RepID=A0ACB8RPJ5_9AGAM|nr:hypothetical protein FA95DRAFT_1561146 [Auriscalpium vulgare]